jgi:hypothetical protein
LFLLRLLKNLPFSKMQTRNFASTNNQCPRGGKNTDYFTSSDPHRDQTKTVIASDTSYGSIYDIYGISFLTFYSSILSDSLIILTWNFDNIFWLSILSFYLASILTSYLASFPASILAFVLIFFPVF